MKKTYMTPEVEIFRVNVEEMIALSYTDSEAGNGDGADDNDDSGDGLVKGDNYWASDMDW